jgi:CheY-like chemotaxis protein
VDDDEISFILIDRMLRNLVVLEYASSGEKALELLKDNIYSMVLLDINLPKGISGLDVLAEIRKMPAYDNIPVVAVTAYSMLGDRENFLAKGCTDYLSKPFTKSQLVELIGQIQN